MIEPEVSILVPVYNVEKYISKCLDSIFSQSYENIYYVFVDDYSSDNSVYILKIFLEKYRIPDYRYKLIQHVSNLGIAATRNDCIEFAQGEYVYFIDSDDWIELDTIEMLVKFTNDSEIDIVGCDFKWEFENGESRSHYENYGVTCHDNLRKCINYEIGTVLWKLLIRRQLFNENKFVDGIDIGEDYLMSIKLYFYSKSFKALHKPFYHYVQFNKYRYSSQMRKSIVNHITAVTEVESFLVHQNFYDQDVTHRLLQRKFQIKSYYLTDGMFNYNLWLTTFPEANHAYRDMNYGFKEKLKFWFAEKKLLHIFKLFK